MQRENFEGISTITQGLFCLTVPSNNTKGNTITTMCLLYERGSVVSL